MNPETEVERLLKNGHAVLKRHRKHEVWEFPDGKTFIKAHTPSDHRAADNQLAELRSILGLADDQRGLPGERRERHYKVSQARPVRVLTPTINTTMRDQLARVGLVEDMLRQQIEQLEDELDAARVDRRDLLADLRAVQAACWCQRIRRTWQQIKGVFWVIFSWPS